MLAYTLGQRGSGVYCFSLRSRQPPRAGGANLAKLRRAPLKQATFSSRNVRFGPFEANLRTEELLRDGVRIKLPQQSFRILALLLERPSELVSREEIRTRLWRDGTVVEFENGINAAVRRLRRALRDSAEKPRYVETLARLGYRFIAVPLEVADVRNHGEARSGGMAKVPAA